jgi:hypothetical protein
MNFFYKKLTEYPNNFNNKSQLIQKVMFTLNLHQKLLVLLILFFTVSCSRNSKLETALELADDNRAELEKVS